MNPEASKESVMPQRSHKEYDFFKVVAFSTGPQ